MTPAINALIKAKLAFTVHEYEHQQGCESYGLEAANKLGLDAQLVFKTLVVRVDSKQLVVAIIPVSSQLSMKLIAKSANAKKATMANSNDVQRATGYQLGGVSPIAQKRRLITFIDNSAENLEKMYVSGGQRGLDVELAPNHLQQLTDASFVNLTA